MTTKTVAEKLFYFALPYSSTKAGETEERVRQMCVADGILMERGISTVSPVLKHLVRQHTTLPGNWAYWENYSKLLLARCDGMIVLKLDGWNVSQGVLGEIEFAKENDIPVYYVTMEQIPYFYPIDPQF